ncbi:hypothetical protein N9777_03595 [Ascidiaceihabitans sp.]|nr:hypothetical protein [Ascidiaceihabitans sp.]
MRRVIQTAAMILTFANAANAQGFGVIARVDPVASEIKDGWFGKSSVALNSVKLSHCGFSIWMHLRGLLSISKKPIGQA